MTLQEIYEILKTDGINLTTKFKFKHDIKTQGKQKTLPLGIIWFNLLLPDDYELVNEAVDKSKLNKIIKQIYDRYEPNITLNVVETINREAFKMGTIVPITFNINEFLIPDFILEKKKSMLSSDMKPDVFVQELNKLAHVLLKYLKENNSGVYDIITSGARTSPLDWAVLILAKGSSTNIEGDITKPILNSVNDGFTLEEFYANGSEARSMLYIRSTSTAEPGALARAVEFANSGTKITSKDCGTQKYYKIILSKNNKNAINGRYFLNEKTNELEMITADTVFNTSVIKMRSPLYCKDKEGICEFCYGDTYKKLETKHIGVLASEVINDDGQAFTMKARHKSSKVEIEQANFLEDIVFLE